MNIGYIGLGAMGGALTRRLLVSQPVTVFDLNTELLNSFAELGADVAESAADLARKSDVILLCLPRSSNVRAAIFGQGGLIEGLAPGKIVIDQTSGDPAETRKMAVELAEKGVIMLDAPVSGGPKAAAAGTIAIMVGGAEDDYQKATPVLSSISPNHTYCGPIGSGQVLKLINNTISTCNRFALLEGLAIGMKNSISLDAMNKVLNAGGARSKSSETLIPMLDQGSPRADFALALMLKDLNLAAGLAMDSEAPMQFGQLARAMLQMAANTLGPDAGIDDIADMVADQAGVDFTE